MPASVPGIALEPSCKNQETNEGIESPKLRCLVSECCRCLHVNFRCFILYRMISYLTPEQASALHAAGNAPMQIVDPTTRRVYYVIDSGLLSELERRSDLDAIREGVADMQAGRSVPIDQARTTDRALLVERLAQ